MALPSVGGGQQLGDGNVAEAIFKTQVPHTTASVTATLTVAQILSGLIIVNQAGAAACTLTMPTASALDTAFPNLKTNSRIDVSFVNISTVGAEDATIAVGTGITAYGNLFVPSNAATSDVAWGTFALVKTGDAAYNLYRVG